MTIGAVRGPVLVDEVDHHVRLGWDDQGAFTVSVAVEGERPRNELEGHRVGGRIIGEPLVLVPDSVAGAAVGAWLRGWRWTGAMGLGAAAAWTGCAFGFAGRLAWRRGIYRLKATRRWRYPARGVCSRGREPPRFPMLDETLQAQADRGHPARRRPPRADSAGHHAGDKEEPRKMG